MSRLGSATARWVAICGVTAIALASFVASTPFERRKPLYAFTTNTRFVVASGVDVIAEYSGNFEDRSWLNWTFDARYAFVLERKTDAQQIVVIDSQTDEIRKLDCFQCTSVTAIADSRIVAVRIDTERVIEPVILVFNLRTKEPPLSYTDPDLVEGLGDIYLLDSLGGQAIAVGLKIGHRVGDEPQLFFINADGSADRLGTITQSDAGVGAVASTLNTATGQPLFAIQGTTFLNTTPSRRCKTDSVSMVHADTGAIAQVDSTPIIESRGGQGVLWSIETSDLWWDEGALFWKVETSDCAYQSQRATDPNRKAQVTSWRLQGRTWIKAEDGNDSSSRAVFTLHDGSSLTIDNDNDRTLYFNRSGSKERVLVASFVNDLATP